MMIRSKEAFHDTDEKTVVARCYTDWSVSLDQGGGKEITLSAAQVEELYVWLKKEAR